MTGVSQRSKGWKNRHSLSTLLLFCLSYSSAWAADEAAATNPAAAETGTIPAFAPSTKGQVARAIFTTAIVDREPVDEVQTLTTDTKRVFFFSDLRGLAGQIVTHRWMHNDQIMAEVTFKVGNGARWRVYSSKNLLPEWTGTWTVVVSDHAGHTLNTSSFEYLPATPVNN